MRISDWSSYVCSSDLLEPGFAPLLDRSQHGHLGRLERAERDFGACNLAGEIGMPQDRFAGRIGRGHALQQIEIGRESCRERGCQYVYISVVAVQLKKKNSKK